VRGQQHRPAHSQLGKQIPQLPACERVHTYTAIYTSVKAKIKSATHRAIITCGGLIQDNEFAFSAYGDSNGELSLLPPGELLAQVIQPPDLIVVEADLVLSVL
jgi:hypothetical protein